LQTIILDFDLLQILVPENTSLATQHSTNNIQILWLSWGPGIGKSSG